MSASFLKSSLSSMTRTRIRSSVEREGVPRDAIPRDAIPCHAIPCNAIPRDAIPGDAVPGDAVPIEVVPGDAVPYDAVPRERLPIDAAERRILPVERRTKEDRVERAGEAVRGLERFIGAGQAAYSLERARQESPRQDPAAARGRRRRRRVHCGVRVEQPAAIRNRIGESLAAVLPVRLRRSGKERLDLIGGEVWRARQEERGGTRHDGGRHRRSGEAEIRRSVL